MVQANGEAFKEGVYITCINEPAINAMRRLSLYSQGKHVFTTESLNFKNYLKKLTLNQDWAASLKAESGYSPDALPFGRITDGPSPTGQQFRRSRLSTSREWALKAPLPLPQFSDSGDYTLVHSGAGISLEFWFENSDFCLFKNVEELADAKLTILDCKLHINYAVVPQAVPRNMTQKFPFTSELARAYTCRKMFYKRCLDYDTLNWNGTATQMETSSGTCHLQNFPSRAILFMTPNDLDTINLNPFEVTALSLSLLLRPSIQLIIAVSRLPRFGGDADGQRQGVLDANRHGQEKLDQRVHVPQTGPPAGKWPIRRRGS